MHVVYGTWNAPWVKHLTQECAAETFPSKVFETFNKVSWIYIWKKIIAFLTQFFAAAKESQEKFRLVWDSNPWPPGCQRLFLARFLSGSWLRPTAEDVSEKNLWYPGYCSSMTSKVPRRENEYAAERRTGNVPRIFVCILVGFIVVIWLS